MARRLLADLVRGIRLGPGAWRDLARAVLELAIARYRLESWFSRELPRAAHEVFVAPAALPVIGRKLALVRRVAVAIPAMGARVPWRSDCIVHARAAQRWLARHGIASSLRIGVNKTAGQRFAAHAWLLVGAELVTGGDIASFAPLRNCDAATSP